MPLTRIAAPEHLPFSQVKSLAGAAQAALVETCEVPAQDLFQLICRFKAEDMILDPTFGGMQRSPDACIVEILFLHGRTDDQKRQLFRATAAGAVAAGFRPDDILIALHENSRADWSLGRGQAYGDGTDAPKGDGCLR
jgi:malonate semialdehyde decarboxylase